MDSRTYDREQDDRIVDDAGNAARRVAEFDRPSARNPLDRSKRTIRSSFFGLIGELRRRRVCRALTMYSVALWLVCQIVEVVSPELALPEWTLRLVIILGLMGFPIALILSWLFDVTPAGMVHDRFGSDAVAVGNSSSRRSRFDQAVDCGLLLIAIFIGAELALSGNATDSGSSALHGKRIAVMPFPVTPADQSDTFSAALLVELQHALARRTTAVVVAPREASRFRNGSTLTGAVTVRNGQVRVAAMVIDNRTGEVTWSEVFQLEYINAESTPAELARGIVSALANSSKAVAAKENHRVFE